MIEVVQWIKPDSSNTVILQAHTLEKKRALLI
jgi:hypothetical protein